MKRTYVIGDEKAWLKEHKFKHTKVASAWTFTSGSHCFVYEDDKLVGVIGLSNFMGPLCDHWNQMYPC